MDSIVLLTTVVVLLIIVLAVITWNKMQNTPWMAKTDGDAADPSKATNAVLVRKVNGVIQCLSYDGIECMRFPTIAAAREFVPDESKLQPIITN